MYFKICPWTLSVPQSLQFSGSVTVGTDDLHGQISEHNFTPNGRPLFNILRNARSFKIGGYHLAIPSFSRGIITHVTLLCQSRKLKYLMD